MGCDIHIYAEVKSNGKWERSLVPIPDDRNYRSFAKLANVRNYSTNPEIVPLSEPRGLPDDCATFDDDLECENPEHVWLGDHSFSWLTLAELRSIDLCEPVTMTGLVKPEVAENYVKYGWEPEEWCQGSNDKTLVSLEWTIPLCKAASLIPRIIMTLVPLGEPDNVRVVFGFDN